MLDLAIVHLAGLFCIPQIILFVCLGAAGRAAMLDDSTSIIGQALLAIGVVTSALIVVLVAKRARAIFADLRAEQSAEAAGIGAPNNRET